MAGFTVVREGSRAFYHLSGEHSIDTLDSCTRCVGAVLASWSDGASGHASGVGGAYSSSSGSSGSMSSVVTPSPGGSGGASRRSVPDAGSTATTPAATTPVVGIGLPGRIEHDAERWERMGADADGNNHNAFVAPDGTLSSRKGTAAFHSRFTFPINGDWL